MSKKTVAVIGANGQIGTLVVKKLIDNKNFKPVAVVRSKLAASILKKKVNKRFEIRVGNLLVDKNKQILEGCEYVINSSLSVGNTLKKDREINNQIFINISKYHKIKKVIHLSSVAVYGINRLSTFTNPKPHNSYGKEKLLHESILKNLFSYKKCEIIILRVGHLYCDGAPLSLYLNECIYDNNFKLPFPNSPSNFVSKNRLLDGIIDCMRSDIKSCTLNLTDYPNKSYLEIFNIHNIKNSMNIEALTKHEAINIKKEILNKLNLFNSIKSSIFQTFKFLIRKMILENDSIRSLGERFLREAPALFEKKVRQKYKTNTVSSQINEYNESKIFDYPDFMFWPPVPGPQVRKNKNTKSTLSQEQKEIHDWYKKIRK